MWLPSVNGWGSNLLKAPLSWEVFHDGFLAHTSGPWELFHMASLSSRVA